jgi:hypothetical protein
MLHKHFTQDCIRYVLLFLQGLCNDATVSLSKFSYGITTSDEGQVITNDDAEGLRGPALLEMLKDIHSLEFPVRSLLRLALEHATPCAAGCTSSLSLASSF